MAGPTCATADVAAIIPERVGATGGDFTGASTPPAAPVTSIIGQVIQEVEAVCGVTIDATLASYATLVVATGAAAQVELSIRSEPDGTEKDSKYEELQLLYRGPDRVNAAGAPVIGGRLGILADAQGKINAGNTPGLSVESTGYAEFPLTRSTDPLSGIPVTSMSPLVDRW